MIAIAEMWPFTKETPMPGDSGRRAIAGVAGDNAAPGARRVLGQGLKAANEEGSVGKVLGKIAKRNAMLLAAGQ